MSGRAMAMDEPPMNAAEIAADAAAAADRPAVHVPLFPPGWRLFQPPPPANTPPFSINLINNRDRDPIYTTNEMLAETIRIVGQPVDIRCKTHEVNADDASEEKEFEQGLLSDDVPSSQGTDVGRAIANSSFAVIDYIRLMFISPYNARNGLFDRIKLIMHHLFFHRGLDGFVGLTRAGVLSEYTATIYYAVPNPFAYYDDIIKIMLHCVETRFRGGLHNGIQYAFKLDRGIKPGDTIKIILSLTFGNDAGANVILIPILNIVTLNISPAPVGPDMHNYMSRFCVNNPGPLNELNAFSIYDLIARIILYANQEAFGALMEPTDVEKALIMCFFHDKTIGQLISFIQYIRSSFYDHISRHKNFAFFLNIFFNFYKVSMNIPDSLDSRSTAKIMYTTFFSTNNNYGSIIRIFINMMRNPLFNEHTIMFLSGSNAARVYSLIQAMLARNPGQDLGSIYDTHMASLSDNDFMFYLKNEDGEPHRMAIRMMLGACLYYLKHILTPEQYSRYTDLLGQSISIVGYDDHLLAQRLNANRVFLEECFNMNPLFGTTIAEILGLCMFQNFDFYELLKGNVTLAFLDVVLKHNTAKEWYIAVFSIFGVPVLAPAVLRETIAFLIDHAMAINCIATPWTLILNILYTIFVTENCIARIVVGKLGNDPKNLKKYFSILKTHLNYLRTQYTAAGNAEMLAHIDELIGHVIIQDGIEDISLQGAIIAQSELCQQPERPELPHLLERYTELKTRCGRWVLKMVQLASNPATRELFFLNANYVFTTPGRISTPIEKGICYAWSVDGNICNKEDFLEGFNPETIAPENFRPVFPVGSVSERTMHDIVPRIQSLITETKDTAEGIIVTPNPTYQIHPPPPPQIPIPIPVPHTQYAYMNWLWKHLTNTSINLRARFKGIVKDAKRIVGSKNFTAISLFGAYPCGLLIDELVESNNTYDTEVQMNALKNSSDIIECRRGLLPLLVPEIPQHDTLFARMVVRLLILDIRINMVIECCKEIHSNFAFRHIDINGIMSQMYNAALLVVLPLDLAIRLNDIVASIIDTCNAVVTPVAGPIPQAAVENIRQNVISRCSETIYSINNILLFLGFLFSIKIKSNASIGPRNMLSLIDSIINFYDLPGRDDILTTVASSAIARTGASAAIARRDASCTLSRLSVNPDDESCELGGIAQSFADIHPSSRGRSRGRSHGRSHGRSESRSRSPSRARARSRSRSSSHSRSRSSSRERSPPPPPLDAPLVEGEGGSGKKSPSHIASKREARSKIVNYSKQLINPESGPFKKFMSKILIVTRQLGIIFTPKTCVVGITKQDIFNIDKRYTDDPTYSPVRLLVGGGDNTCNNKTKSNNKKFKTNHTRKRRYSNGIHKRIHKRKKNKNKAKHITIVTSYQSKSQCNKNKYKSKITQRNVTFKRKRYNNN
jgi:hypothetical protein